MSLKICSLASGSRGNSVLFTDGVTTVLIDQGLTFREFKKRLAFAGLTLGGIGGVVCTHSHTDHTKGLKDFCEKSGRCVHIHSDGAASLTECSGLSGETLTPFSGEFEIGTIKIRPVRVSHDVPCCTGFVISGGGKRAAYFTDLGFADDAVREAAAGVDALFAEANHDLDMLMCGSYPYMLKKRILSERGHLSNDACADLSLYAVKNGARNIILGHLSENNNLPELAFETVSRRLASEGLDEGKSYRLHLALQHGSSGWIEL